MEAFIADLFSFRFLQYALAAGLLASVACGIMGTFVVVRRISYIAGAMAHCTLGGMGAAMYLNRECGQTWATPTCGAVASAMIAATIMAWARTKKQREDSLIGAIWATGMAIGIIFISMTSGYTENLMGYLFGDILMVSESDLMLMAMLDITVLVFTMMFYNKLLAVCFDEEFATLSGLNTDLYYFIMLCLIGLTVVTLVQVVGIIMVIALLTLPAASASMFVNRLACMMMLSSALCMISMAGGLAASYAPDLPSGAVIIIFSAAIYLAAICFHEYRYLINRFSGKNSWKIHQNG